MPAKTVRKFESAHTAAGYVRFPRYDGRLEDTQRVVTAPLRLPEKGP